MANVDARLEPHSPEMRAAIEAVTAAIDVILGQEQLIREIEALEQERRRPRMPKPRTLEDVFAEIRARGYDDVFTSENPGP